MKNSEIIIISFGAIIIVSVVLAIFYKPAKKTDIKNDLKKESIFKSIFEIVDGFKKTENETDLSVEEQNQINQFNQNQIT